MQWIKHMTAANRDERLIRLRHELGTEAYGAYWLILEAIAEQLTEHSPRTSATFPVKNWRLITGLSKQKLDKLLRLSAEVGLFLVEKNEDFIRVDCPKLLKIQQSRFFKGPLNSASDSAQPLAGRIEEEKKEKTYKKEVTPSVPLAPAEPVPDAPPDATEFDDPVQPGIPPCPHRAIIAAYHEILPGLPAVKLALYPGTTRQTDLRNRWKESPKHQDVRFWQAYFRKVAASPFLMGELNTTFRADFAWLVKRGNFVKVWEGRYDAKS